MYRKNPHIGKNFSAYVHGMFMHPRATIRKIVQEPVDYRDLAVPFAVVLAASVFSSFGAHIWAVTFEKSVFFSFVRVIGLFLDLFLRPFWLIFIVWLPTSLIIHFIGSIVTGQDITDSHKLHKTIKLTGFSMAPVFLNILPFFDLITGFWIWILLLWCAKMNYSASKEGAFVITLPFLFAISMSFLMKIGLL